MYGYGNASLSPKGPSSTGSISALGVVPARTTSSGRDPKGESPGGNFRLQEVSGEPGWLFTDPFQNILFFLLLNFVQIFHFSEIIRSYPGTLPTEL